MVQLKRFAFNPFQENTYILYDDTKECVIVDPGCYELYEQKDLTDFIEEKELKVVKLVNTHCHVDHVLGNYFVKEKYKVPLIIHANDKPTLESVKAYAPVYGFNNYVGTTPDSFLDEGEQLTFGNSALDVLFVPGHAPGHIAFYAKEEKIIIGGDVLFRGSIGRTDLPAGDFETLIQSIKNKLFILPDDVLVFPGHGPETNIGYERLHNPFCGINV